MDIARLDTARPAPAATPPADTRPRAPATPATGTAAAPAAPVGPRAVAEAVDSTNAYLQSQPSSSIQFSIDKDTGRTVVKMVDTETKEILRQIPSEEMLAISRSIEKMRGVMIDEKA